MPELEDIDKEGMINYLDNFWKQCEDASKLGTAIKIDQPVDGIILCGMGGSALPGEIIKGYIQVNIPVDVVRDYKLPNWAGKNTLVFIISYSGNTEEALSCLKSSKAKGTKVLCIASGGKLKEICERTGTPIITVPRGLQPRASSGYMTMPILNFLMNSRIIPDKSEEIKDTVRALKKDIKESAQGLSHRLIGKIPLIYSSDNMVVVARLWKAAVNENAKHPAFFNVFPEMNHNDLIGFNNTEGNFYFIFIEDADDHARIKKRMKITKDILNKNELPVLILKLTGPNKLARIFSSMLMGMYVGYFLALEYGIDPSPVDVVEDLKKQLGTYIG